MAPDLFVIEASGDILDITHDGTMWFAPSRGSLYPGRYSAMRVEVHSYLLESGDPDCPEDAGDIDLDKYGHWLTPKG